MNAVRIIQAVYMPCAPRLLAQHKADLLEKHAKAAASSGPPDIPTPATSPPHRHRRAALPDDLDLPEEQPLFLPNELSEDDLDQCSAMVAEIESRVREGQMRDALDKMRIQLHVKSRLLKFKAKNVRHQGACTRSMTQLEANEAQIFLLAEKYRAAYAAKLSLCGNGHWQNEWRILNRGDIRCMRQVDVGTRQSGEDILEEDTASEADEPTPDLVMQSEVNARANRSRGNLSWIWLAADRNGNAVSGMSDGMWNLISKLYGVLMIP